MRLQGPVGCGRDRERFQTTKIIIMIIKPKKAKGESASKGTPSQVSAFKITPVNRKSIQHFK